MRRGQFIEILVLKMTASGLARSFYLNFGRVMTASCLASHFRGVISNFIVTFCYKSSLFTINFGLVMTTSGLVSHFRGVNFNFIATFCYKSSTFATNFGYVMTTSKCSRSFFRG